MQVVRAYFEEGDQIELAMQTVAEAELQVPRVVGRAFDEAPLGADVDHGLRSARCERGGEREGDEKRDADGGFATDEHAANLVLAARDGKRRTSCETTHMVRP